MAKRKKPKIKTRQAYDYHEAAAHIESLLGYDLRDVKGKFGENYKSNSNVEYCDYWHMLCDTCNINNGCYIYISSGLLGGEVWQDEITQKFIDEFGDDTEYWVSW